MLIARTRDGGSLDDGGGCSQWMPKRRKWRDKGFPEAHALQLALERDDNQNVPNKYLPSTLRRGKWWKKISFIVAPDPIVLLAAF